MRIVLRARRVVAKKTYNEISCNVTCPEPADEMMLPMCYDTKAACSLRCKLDTWYCRWMQYAKLVRNTPIENDIIKLQAHMQLCIDTVISNKSRTLQRQGKTLQHKIRHRHEYISTKTDSIGMYTYQYSKRLLSEQLNKGLAAAPDSGQPCAERRTT